MDIKSVGTTNFGAGKVILTNIEKSALKTYNSIKDIAITRDYDIYISKSNRPLKTMRNYDAYHVMAAKKNLKGIRDIASNSTIAKKGTPMEEVSKQIHETVKSTVDKLFSKRCKNRGMIFNLF